MTNFSSNDKDIIEKSIDVKESPSANIISDCDTELQRCVKWIIENKHKRVCLQLPDELLCHAWHLTNYFKKHTQSRIFILADTSYSGCCIDATAAAHVEADSLIHFGAACLSPHFGLSVFYVFETKQLNLPDCLEAIRSVAVKKTLLFYDTKYHSKLGEIKDGLKCVKNVFICEIATCEIDDLLFGRKVPKTNYERAIYLGPESMLLTNLTLIFSNLEWFHYENVIQPLALKTSKFLMKRLHLVEKLKDVSVVGVLIGTLSIAGSLQAVDRIKKLCKSSGKKCYTVAVGRPNVAKLANLPEIEAYVLVSCPENQLFIEFGDFYQPILSMIEVELALGSKPWSTDYTFDFRQLQLGGRMACTSEPESVLPCSDVSLITGKTRTGTHLINSNASELVLKGSGTMIESRAADFLLQRTWGGLEQKLGETAVEKFSQGRSGVPITYDNEKCNK